MTVTFAEGQDQIAKLAEHFRTNRTTYFASNEADARQSLIDPLFMALGWDVRNESRTAPQYREVIPEESLEVEGHRRAPDYTFRVGQTPKFYAEAKRTGVNVKDDPGPAYQLRRYSWSAKLPFSILTSFEQLAVYDCRMRPAESDKASQGRISFYTCAEYADRWRELWDVFSREAVWSGSFDQFTQSQRGKRGTSEVDSEFLKEIEGWRDLLARNIALRNPGIAQRDLNFAVQCTIDRMVFLRICEDRGIEPYGTLQALGNGGAVYARLGELFQKADQRYNSGLFYFTAERDRDEPPDETTLALTIDDKPLKDILKSLYFPESPYEFSVLPAEILGQVYEQFLGKVIRLTKGGQAKVEEKPEVRKAGGVYYTPASIVDYIVRNTVGKLLEGKTPKEAARLRILDPACGSGSFLIGAYRFLLDWHRDWYVQEDPQRRARGRTPVVYQGAGGQWRLTTSEKKRILLNNIYGVDIDAQAVEVTKLSLLLKVLEGESSETISAQMRFFHERALPDLAANVKCGNSLIGPDFYNGRQLSLLDDEEQWRINAFDWQSEFPAIFKAGGFDAVIGNPPYIRVTNVPEAHRPYLYRRFDLTHRFDMYVAFVMQGFELLSRLGRFGFIIPNKFITADYGASLRRLLTRSAAVCKIVDFGDTQVFQGPTTYTCLLFLTKEHNSHFEYIQSRAGITVGTELEPRGSLISVNTLAESPWALVDESANALLSRIGVYPPLGESAIISHGLQTGYDNIFVLSGGEAITSKPTRFSVHSRLEDAPFAIERAATRLVVKGAVDVRRYYIEDSKKWVLFPYVHSKDGPKLIDEDVFAHTLPLAWAYLKRHEAEMRRRKGKNWYAYRRRNYDLAEGVPRLLVPSISQRACFAYDPTGSIHYIGSGGGGGGGYGLTLRPTVRFSALYLLGLLNSKLLDWHVKLRTSRFGHGYYAFNRQYIEPLPIRPIDFSVKSDKSRHDRMVQLVERMLELHKKLAAARGSGQQTFIRRQIDATDRRIDQLVYELYGLTDEEIAVVEGTAAGATRQSGEESTVEPG